MNVKKIDLEIAETMAELLKTLDFFDEAEINLVPFKDSWTAGMLAQHLVMSHSGFMEMINGPVKETVRQADEQEEKIKADFLNFDIKMKSPDFVIPPAKPYRKEALMDSLKELTERIGVAAKTIDLSKTCLALELPVYGFLTRIEAIYFMCYHTKRHIHQLKNIHDKVVVSFVAVKSNNPAE